MSAAEAALKLVDQDITVEEKALSVVDQAKAVKVVDAGTYTEAGHLWKSIGDMIKEVKETFDPICDAAHKAHKQAVEKRSKYLDPLTSAQKSVKQLMSAYDAQQEAIRLAEQRRLEEIARKEAEERALMDAIAAEEEAQRNGATKEEAQQESAAIISQPVYVAPVVLQKETPRVAGLSFRTIWKARVVNEALIPRQFMAVDMVKVNGVVRSLKGQHGIPGIEAYEERC